MHSSSSSSSSWVKREARSPSVRLEFSLSRAPGLKGERKFKRWQFQIDTAGIKTFFSLKRKPFGRSLSFVHHQAEQLNRLKLSMSIDDKLSREENLLGDTMRPWITLLLHRGKFYCFLTSVQFTRDLKLTVSNDNHSVCNNRKAQEKRKKSNSRLTLFVRWQQISKMFIAWLSILSQIWGGVIFPKVLCKLLVTWTNLTQPVGLDWSKEYIRDSTVPRMMKRYTWVGLGIKNKK